MKKRWNKKTKMVILSSDEVGIATYTPVFITPIPKSKWSKAEVKEVKMPEPKRRHKGEPCSYTEDINCQEDTCLNCATFEKYIKSIP